MRRGRWARTKWHNRNKSLPTGYPKKIKKNVYNKGDKNR
jgi:hypothetical protein